MKRTLTTVALTVAAAVVLAVGLAGLVITRGLYDIGATTQHTQPVFGLLETTMKYAVRIRAADIVPPAPSPPGLIMRGAACYRDHCVQCHGGPGVAPGPVGMSMQPLPGPLLDAARRWHEREIYWITRHGIRMSGMPAWGMRMSEADLWAVARFIGRMPELSSVDYRAQMAQVQGNACTLPSSGLGTTVSRVTAAEAAERAQLALRQYACVSCHTIPGVTGSDTRVGPPLGGLARRALIAGRLPNTEDNLVQWIRSPQQVKPGTAMPDLDVTEEHARLLAHYLSKLH